MKRIIAAVLCLLCLTGCSSDDPVPETSAFPVEIVPRATEAATVPSETQPPTTEPAYNETEPQNVIKQPEPEDEDFVKVVTYIPDIVVDLRYSTDLNFTSKQIYHFTDAWLRYGTVKKLQAVQEELRQDGLSLKIWDGFRPPSAQFKLWEVCPDPTYVSDPNNGFSSHSRGNTVDVTLVYTDGAEVSMPTGFDDFSKLADRDYSDCTEEAAANALFLEQLMIKHGFKPYSGEWWHFSDTQSYPVDPEFEPAAPSIYYADCNEFITLRTKPDTSAEVITKILVGEQFVVVAECGDFAVVEYQNLYGYVLRSYIQPVF
ncbi:MAG: SH3 domain-containing protein [Oscillospiraceae bacterium]|nr:SH3 domain-containing protein [Oscillospiraceae bacterium]